MSLMKMTGFIRVSSANQRCMMTILLLPLLISYCDKCWQVISHPHSSYLSGWKNNEFSRKSYNLTSLELDGILFLEVKLVRFRKNSSYLYTTDSELEGRRELCKVLFIISFKII
jgi:hypothetical protein